MSPQTPNLWNWTIENKRAKMGPQTPDLGESRSLRFVVWLVGVEWSVSSYRFEKGLDRRWSCWRDIGFGGFDNTSDSLEPRRKVALLEAEGWWAGSSSRSSTQILRACRLKWRTSSWRSTARSEREFFTPCKHITLSSMELLREK